MDKKIIFSLLGSVLVAFTFIFFVPIFYAAVIMKSFYAVTIFFVPAIITATLGITFARLGKNHRRRLPIFESALAMLAIYPLIAAIGLIPFLVTGWLFPFDAILETVSDLTSAGLSLLSPNAPYILKIWQSLLMWFGSLIFLVMLVTIMPEVSGCFGLSMSLQGGQLFSPLFGQMNTMSQRMIKIYSGLTLASFLLFKLSGLNFWDALLMSARCISTGGGNFLLYYRLIQTIPPPRTGIEENFFQRGINYVKRLRKNILGNIKTFFTNSEVKACSLIIFFSSLMIFFVAMLRNPNLNPNETFRHSFFHVISYLSTTGINLINFETVHDFDVFLIMFMAILGGCMGSVTGGLKMVRILILIKSAAIEIKKTMHPHMLASIRINESAVPNQIVGRILGFFFLGCITIFVSSAILSFLSPQFSDAVAVSVACLTNVGSMPQIVNPQLFLRMSDFAKIFCAVICIVGRIEIFALLIALASLKIKNVKRKW